MMRRSLALCLFALASIATNAFALGEARVTGKITDAVTKEPLPEATITVEAVEGKNFKQVFNAKKDGSYAIFLLDGTIKYKFTYTAPGHQPFQDVYKLKLGEPNQKDMTLNPAGAATATVSVEKPVAKQDPAVVAYNEGASLANAGDDAKAVAKFEEAVVAKPDLIAAHEAAAKVYLRMKDYPKAIDHANKALAIDAGETEMNGVLFDAYNATGDKAKAAEVKKKLPANAAGLFNDAAKLINAGKDADAEPLLKQAIAADDKFAPAYYELGMLYVRTQKNADAKANLQKYLELDPKGKDAPTAKEMLNYVK